MGVLNEKKCKKYTFKKNKKLINDIYSCHS